MNVTFAPYLDTLRNAHTLINEATVHGGTTINRLSGDVPTFTSGYYVGGKFGQTLKLHDSNSSDWLVQTVAAWLQALPTNVEYVGSWVDDASSLIYFDATDYVVDRVEAAKLGIARNELAIWDIKAGESITRADCEVIVAQSNVASSDDDDRCTYAPTEWYDRTVLQSNRDDSDIAVAGYGSW